MSGWLAVDLDGTLAEYDKFRGHDHIGAPIPAMVERVKALIASGFEVRIFTARVADPTEWKCEKCHDMGTAWSRDYWRDPATGLAGRKISSRACDCGAREPIDVVRDWVLAHIGLPLKVTNLKDQHMVELWDDRCVQVEKNTGRLLGTSRLKGVKP